MLFPTFFACHFLQYNIIPAIVNILFSVQRKNLKILHILPETFSKSTRLL